MAGLCSGATHGHSPTRAVIPVRRGVRASAGTSYQDVAPAVDYRRVLGVGPNASNREVKAAYRRLALRVHPDVCRDDECDVSFMEVNRAYESLMALGPSVGDQSQKCKNYEAGADSAPPNQEGDDPWADFLQTLANGTREDQFQEDFSSYYSNLKFYSKAKRRYTGASQYYNGN